MNRDPNCWTWDSYLGECRQWHPVVYHWYEHVNVFSISAVAGMWVVATFAVVFLLARWCEK